MVGAPSAAWPASWPDPTAYRCNRCMAQSLGSEYMELVRRAYRPGTPGDLQLLLAPFNSRTTPTSRWRWNRRTLCTSHASVWMYLERIPLVVDGPGLVVVVRPHRTALHRLADLLPRPHSDPASESLPTGRPQRALRFLTATTCSLRRRRSSSPSESTGAGGTSGDCPTCWSNLRRLMDGGANFRNAIHGSFPAYGLRDRLDRHRTYPDEHGITGHNIRDDQGVVRKAYGEAGRAIRVHRPAHPCRTFGTRTGGRAGWGESATRCGTWACWGSAAGRRADRSSPWACNWDEDDTDDWRRTTPTGPVPPRDARSRHVRRLLSSVWGKRRPTGTRSSRDRAGRRRAGARPVVTYQGDLIEATLDSEPIGEGDATSLL